MKYLKPILLLSSIYLTKVFFLFFIELPLLSFLIVKLIKLRYLTTKDIQSKPRLFWGPTPLINNKYYSKAMGQAGYYSRTVMEGFFGAINSRQDFDELIFQNKPFHRIGFLNFLTDILRTQVQPYTALMEYIERFDIFHFSFNGGILKNSKLKKFEASFIHFARKKIVVLGYGSDFYQYSKVLNKSWTHTLLTHYPFFGKYEKKVAWQVKYWTRHADCIINGMQIDGIGRWEALPFRAECIDVDDWKPKKEYSDADGKSGAVTIVHAPNHRFIKGTEYLISSVETLKREGLNVELILLEKLQNTEVKRILQEKADIFFDQLILGYAMSTIEAFALGLPVITNLENEDYTRVFRRYSYLNECPAMSVSHETLTDVLRTLVTSPSLRKELGEAGRAYAEKYHSYHTAQTLFGKVYDKIWFEKEVDLINHYHPLLPDSYNNVLPLVEHPLVENKIIK